MIQKLFLLRSSNETELRRLSAGTRGHPSWQTANVTNNNDDDNDNDNNDWEEAEEDETTTTKTTTQLSNKIKCTKGTKERQL